MYFPATVVGRTPRLEYEGGVLRVVPFLEEAGFTVTKTTNEIRARWANAEEQAIFQIGDTDIVIEHAHGTYGADGEALEAVVNARPAQGNVVTFDTYEAPVNDEEE